MRVALIVPVPTDPGDDEATLLHRHRFNIAQARALGRAGAEVELIVDAPFSAQNTLDPGVRIRFVRSPTARFLGGAHLIGRAVQGHAEVIHVFHLLSVKTLALAVLARARVYAEYNGGAIPSSAARRIVLNAASRRLSGVFFTSSVTAKTFQDAGALARSLDVFDVPELSSLLDPSSIARDTARASSGVDEAFVVLVAGRIAADKQPFVALEAFRAIARVRPNASLWWAYGRDELGGALQKEAANDRVRFFVNTPHAEMSRLYAAADVMIHATRRETCSAVFIEALQHGLPVAASDIPPLAAMAGPGVRLTPTGDPQALAHAAMLLADDPRARDDARRTFRDHLSYDVIGRRKLAAYSRAD